MKGVIQSLPVQEQAREGMSARTVFVLSRPGCDCADEAEVTVFLLLYDIVLLWQSCPLGFQFGKRHSLTHNLVPTDMEQWLFPTV